MKNILWKTREENKTGRLGSSMEICMFPSSSSLPLEKKKKKIDALHETWFISTTRPSRLTSRAPYTGNSKELE